MKKSRVVPSAVGRIDGPCLLCYALLLVLGPPSIFLFLSMMTSSQAASTIHPSSVRVRCCVRCSTQHSADKKKVCPSFRPTETKESFRFRTFIFGACRTHGIVRPSVRPPGGIVSNMSLSGNRREWAPLSVTATAYPLSRISCHCPALRDAFSTAYRMSHVIESCPTPRVVGSRNPYI